MSEHNDMRYQELQLNLLELKDMVKAETDAKALKAEYEQFDYDFRLSKALSASQMTGVFKTPEQVFTAIQYGRGHGWSPMQSLRNLYPLHGNVHLTAIAAMGLVLPHADTPPKIDREDKDGKPFSCTVTYTRGKQEFSRSFNLDQAKAAGLIKGGGAWTAYAENMLFWRAGMFAAREAFPDILAGIYSIEEMSNTTAEEYQQELKDITPKDQGTGFLDVMEDLVDDDLSTPKEEDKGKEKDNWPRLRYGDKSISEPEDKQPDPDLIMTADKDVVSTESKEMKKIKEAVRKDKKKDEKVDPELF